MGKGKVWIQHAHLMNLMDNPQDRLGHLAQSPSGHVFFEDGKYRSNYTVPDEFLPRKKPSAQTVLHTAIMSFTASVLFILFFGGASFLYRFLDLGYGFHQTYPVTPFESTSPYASLYWLLGCWSHPYDRSADEKRDLYS